MAGDRGSLPPQTAEAGRARSLEASGAVIFRFLPDPDGRIGIRPLLKSLAEQGVLSLMVEGGAQVITSFYWPEW